MDKSELDAVFVRLMPMLRRKAKVLLRKYNRRHDADAVLSEAYIYVLSKINEVNSRKMVKAYVVTFIQKSIIWNESKLEKKSEDGSRQWSRLVLGIDLDVFFVDDTDDLDEKIKDERIGVMGDVFLSHFESMLIDPVEKIIFDRIVRKRCYTVRGLAGVFEISSTQAFGLKKKMMIKLKDFANKEGYIND